MYRVLLVDDEIAVTYSLQKSVNWASLNMTVASVCRSGRQAMDYIAKNHVDIVITDICMPDMDGLSLCQEITKSDSRIQIIIISSFAEFSYAKKAISFGVLGYCLKPIEYAELERYLHQAAVCLSPKSYHRGGDYDDLLESIYSGNPEELAQQLRWFGFSDKQYYAAASVSKLPLMERSRQVIPIQIGFHRYVYISKEPIRPEQMSVFFSRCECKGVCFSATSVEVRVLGETVKRLARNSLNYFIDSSRIIFSGDERNHRSLPIFPEFEKNVSLRNTKQILELLNQTQTLSASAVSLSGAWELYHLFVADEYYGSLINHEEIYSIEQMVASFETFDTMISKIYAGLSGTEFSQTQAEISNTTFLQILKLIDAHLMEDYSLGQIAEEMHMNRNYLGQVFKKESGQTFTNYFMTQRIEKAKQMLIDKNMSISNVASSLGFNDYFYFLKTFKRVVGVTPKQYVQGELQRL